MDVVFTDREPDGGPGHGGRECGAATGAEAVQGVALGVAARLRFTAALNATVPSLSGSRSR
jgi:hypothetical protein